MKTLDGFEVPEVNMWWHQVGLYDALEEVYDEERTEYDEEYSEYIQERFDVVGFLVYDNELGEGEVILADSAKYDEITMRDLFADLSGILDKIYKKTCHDFKKWYYS